MSNNTQNSPNTHQQESADSQLVDGASIFYIRSATIICAIALLYGVFTPMYKIDTIFMLFGCLLGGFAAAYTVFPYGRNSIATMISAYLFTTIMLLLSIAVGFFYFGILVNIQTFDHVKAIAAVLALSFPGALIGILVSLLIVLRRIR